MPAFNAVRFRVKLGRDQQFLDAHKSIAETWPGLKHDSIIKTGDHAYCLVAEWQDMNACSQARPEMIATLNSFRDTLEDSAAVSGSPTPWRSGGSNAEIVRERQLGRTGIEPVLV